MTRFLSLGLLALVALVALIVPIAASAPGAGRHVAIFPPRGVGNDFARVRPLRRVVLGPQLLRSAMQALRASPTRAERPRGYSSWFSATTDGHLRGVRVSDGVAYIDFRSFASHILNASTSCGSTLLLAQLDRTARQFPTVKGAVYSFSGSRHASTSGCSASRRRADG